MRETSMGIRLCMLVVFISSVCQGAALPSQTLDCIDCIRETGSSLQNSREPCASSNQFSERRKRQIEIQAVDTSTQPSSTEAQPSSTKAQLSSTEAQPSSTEAQPPVENLTSAVPVLTSSLPSEVVPSLPPPPHPLAAQATVVKPRSCKSGSTWEEECNTCWCLDNGMAACTVKRCEVISPVSAAKISTTMSPTETMPAGSTPTSVQSSSIPSVKSSSTSIESPSTSVQSETTSVQSLSMSVQSSSTSVQSSSTSVQPPTTSVQLETTSVQPHTSVQPETSSVQSETTSAQESSSVLPTSPTTSVQSSTSSSGGTS